MAPVAPSRTVRLAAPAKLNLGLSVGAPGSGSARHPVCSWMVTIDLCDELTVTRLPDDRLSRYAIQWHAEARRRRPIDWSVTQDLAVQAHLALERHVGRGMPVQMRLDKRIPIGGGLGGGSSDAAAMLRAVNALFDLHLSVDELAAIGAELGSDVPFLVHGGSAVVRGAGERIERRRPPVNLHAILALPEAACGTAAVYGEFDRLAPDAAVRADAVDALANDDAPLVDRAGALFNDLAPAVERLEPSLAEARHRLAEATGRPAHVTGSGSSLFVLCDNAVEAQALAEAVGRVLSMPVVAVGAYDPQAVAPQPPVG